MSFEKLKNVKLELEFIDGDKRHTNLEPQMIQELMSFHDISALEEAFQALLKSKE